MHEVRARAGRTQVVFGAGDRNADLVFVGEGPGAEEDKQGIPFVGRSGEPAHPPDRGDRPDPRRGLHLQRGEVPSAGQPRSRSPRRSPRVVRTSSRSSTCSSPSVIVTLGNFATKLLLDTKEGITKLRGREFPARNGTAAAAPDVAPRRGAPRRRTGAGAGPSRLRRGQARAGPAHSVSDVRERPERGHALGRRDARRRSFRRRPARAGRRRAARGRARRGEDAAREGHRRVARRGASRSSAPRSRSRASTRDGSGWCTSTCTASTAPRRSSTSDSTTPVTTSSRSSSGATSPAPTSRPSASRSGSSRSIPMGRWTTTGSSR